MSPTHIIIRLTQVRRKLIRIWELSLSGECKFELGLSPPFPNVQTEYKGVMNSPGCQMRVRSVLLIPKSQRSVPTTFK